jgi:transposase
MVVVLDNARYHRARLLTEFLRSHRSCMRLDFLPPYSPQLAPIERVWKLLRRLATHNQYFPELKDLLEAVMRQVDLWAKPNDILKRLCCIY